MNSKNLLADITNPLFDSTPFANDLTGEAFTSALISGVIKVLLLVGVIYFIIHFMLGAIKWIMSEGDKGKLEQAQKQVQNAILGLFILFLVFVILYFIGTFFGLQGLQNLDLQWPTI